MEEASYGKTRKRSTETSTDSKSRRTPDEYDREKTFDPYRRVYFKSGTNKAFSLPKRGLLTATFLLTTQAFNVNSTCYLILRWGPLEVLIGYVLLSIVITAPLTMVYLFLGKYSKSNYIKIWEMLPILKGLAWCVTIYQFAIEIFNVSYGAIGLLYTASLFSKKIPWSDCSFPEASNRCVSMNPTDPYKLKCCSNIKDDYCFTITNASWISYPAFEYYQRHVFDIEGLSENNHWVHNLRPQLIIYAAITWFFIYVALLRGYQKFIKFVFPIMLALILLHLISALIIVFIYGSQYPSMSIARFDVENLISFKFWVAVTSNIIFELLPLQFICLGSVAYERMKPTQTAIEIVMIKLIWLLLFCCTISIGIQMLAEHYKVEDLRCIHVGGNQLIFVISIDLFTRFPVAQLFLISYFISYWLNTYFATVMTLGLISNSIMDVFPKVARFRVAGITFGCFLLTLLTIPILNNRQKIFTIVWRTSVIYQANILIVFLFVVGISIYSFKKLENDYYFTYGVMIRQYWIVCLKLTVLVTGMLLFALCTHRKTYPTNPYITSTMKYICYIFLGITFLPIPIHAGLLYINYQKLKKTIRIIQPTLDWGPPTAFTKYRRLRFNPERHVCLNKSDEVCKHNCLLYSNKLKEEIRAWKLNYVVLKENM